MTQPLRAMEVTGSDAPDQFRTGLTRPQSEDDDLTQVQRLDRPKCDVIGSAERVEQLCKSVAASYFHVHICQQIENHIGSGEPLDVLLNDMFYRRKFGLAPRAL